MRFLFIGLGSIATKHIEDVCDIAKKQNIDIEIDILRRKISDLPVKIASFVSRQITELDDTMYDSIFITNPTVLHYETLCKVKDKGKFYFIEKPIFNVTNVNLKSIGISEENSYVAAPMRHTKVYKELKTIVNSHKIFSARIICSSYLPEWRPNSDYRQIYSAIRALGGGVTLDLIHEIDYMVGLFGFPEEIYNLRGKYSNLEIDSDDLSIYIAKYKTLLCEVHLDYFGKKYRRTCEIFTEVGTFIADFGAESITCPDGTKISCLESERDIYSEMRYYLNFISGKEKNLNPPELGVKVLKYSLGEI